MSAKRQEAITKTEFETLGNIELLISQPYLQAISLPNHSDAGHVQETRAAHCNRKLTALHLGFTGDYPYHWSLKLIVLQAIMLTANYC